MIIGKNRKDEDEEECDDVEDGDNGDDVEDDDNGDDVEDSDNEDDVEDGDYGDWNVLILNLISSEYYLGMVRKKRA